MECRGATERSEGGILQKEEELRASRSRAFPAREFLCDRAEIPRIPATLNAWHFKGARFSRLARTMEVWLFRERRESFLEHEFRRGRGSLMLLESTVSYLRRKTIELGLE